jgi:cytoskeleton protein RodZ
MIEKEVEIEIDSVGDQLKSCREKMNITQAEISSQLHLDSRIIRAIEENDYNTLPDPIYVRGYIRGYCKLLGQNPDEFLELFKKNVNRNDPEIIPEIKYPTQTSSSDKPVKAFTYLITLGLVLLVIAWWQSNFMIKNETVAKSVQTQQIDDPKPEPSLTEITNETSVRFSSLPTNNAETISSPTDYFIDSPTVSTEDIPAVDAEYDDGLNPDFIENLANISIAEETSLIDINQQIDESTDIVLTADLPDQSTLSSTSLEPVGPDSLDIYVSSDSWIEIFDVNEQQIYFDLGRTGDQLSLKGTAPFNVILGFAQGVTIELNGKRFDQSPYTRSGVARFKLEE